MIFFLIVNTTYYWEGKLELFAFPVFLILVIIFLGLGVALIRQIYFLVKENFKDNKRIIDIGLITLILTLIFLKPYGLIDLDKLEGDNILIAEKEGSANCMTTLKLKDNFKFSVRSVCFGITEIKGKFRLQNDTIFFDYVNVGRHENELYKFGIVNLSNSNNSKSIPYLTIYKKLTDTNGHKLWITKNDLNKLENKKPNR
jgi:hypothetical protein